MRQPRRLGICTAVISALLWLATIAVALVMIDRGAEGSGLGVLEDLLRAASATVTIAGAVVFRASILARSRFEHGYLAGQRDARPARVTSIASHAVAGKLPRQDRQDSNKL